MSDTPPVDNPPAPPTPPANPPTPPAPPADPPTPPANPPSDAVSRSEFSDFSRTVTESIAGLTDAVTKLTDSRGGGDETPVDVPWTHRFGRRKGDA